MFFTIRLQRCPVEADTARHWKGEPASSLTVKSDFEGVVGDNGTDDDRIIRAGGVKGTGIFVGLVYSGSAFTK